MRSRSARRRSPPASKAFDLLLVGVPQPGVARHGRGSAAWCRARRCRAPSAGCSGVLYASADSRAIRAAASANSEIRSRDAVLPERGEIGAEGVGLDRIDADVEVRVVDRPDDVWAGDVQDLVAALELIEVLPASGRNPAASCPLRRPRSQHAATVWYGGLRRRRRSGHRASRENNRPRPTSWAELPRCGAQVPLRRDGYSEAHARLPSSAGRDLRDLVDPVVVMAFGGWNDAGNAATGASRTSCRDIPGRIGLRTGP